MSRFEMKPAELILGTAQLGMAYGITNELQKPDFSECSRMLGAASRCGIKALDTARAYGDSEEQIGRTRKAWLGEFNFEVVTKIDPMTKIDLNDAQAVKACVLNSVHASTKTLGSELLDCVLLHRPAHRTCAGGAAWDTLKSLRNEGIVRKIGVSVSTPEEMVDALDDPDMQHIQLPYNCIDHRFESPAALNALSGRPDVVIHVRSVLLQGLIAFGTRERMVSLFGDDGDALHAFVESLPLLTGLQSRLCAAIAYVRSVGWIDGVVVGAASEAQIESIAEAFQHRLDTAPMAAIRQMRPRFGENVLNPALWKTA